MKSSEPHLLKNKFRRGLPVKATKFSTMQLQGYARQVLSLASSKTRIPPLANYGNKGIRIRRQQAIHFSRLLSAVLYFPLVLRPQGRRVGGAGAPTDLHERPWKLDEKRGGFDQPNRPVRGLLHKRPGVPFLGQVIQCKFAQTNILSLELLLKYMILLQSKTRKHIP